MTRSPTRGATAGAVEDHNGGGVNGANGAKDAKAIGRDGEIDRESVCPFLLRVFCSTSRHNPIMDYNRGEMKQHRPLENPYLCLIDFQVIVCPAPGVPFDSV